MIVYFALCSVGRLAGPDVCYGGQYGGASIDLIWVTLQVSWPQFTHLILSAPNKCENHFVQFACIDLIYGTLQVVQLGTSTL